MQAAAIFGVLLFAVEMFLLLCFISAYYRSGIVLFKERILASQEALEHFDPHALDLGHTDINRQLLVFQSIDEETVGFRHSQTTFFARRHIPLLFRGRVDVDPRRREVRVVGMCSWIEIFIPLAMAAVIEFRYIAVGLPIYLLLYFVLYRQYRKTFGNVVRAVRWQLTDHATVDLTQRVDAYPATAASERSKGGPCHS